MKLEIKENDGLYCGLSVFKINDIFADSDDFGEKYDHNPEYAPEYGCGNMMFESKEPTQEVLDKYHITKEEYEDVCDELYDKLSFGFCAYCS